jgi:ComF family protein
MYGIINKTNVQNVKNTMIDTLLSAISPHLCYACGRIESILCDNCKYDITYDHFNECILCSSTCEPNGICSTCKPCFSRAWCVSQRKEVLRKVIDDYKFENVMAAHVPLAALLSAVIGMLPSSVVLVPIPTIPAHIRRRGYDHAVLLAKQLAKVQSVKMKRILQRASYTEQRGGTKVQRHAMAREAFKVRTLLNGGVYLLVDDVVTTGATLQSAARILLDAGADEVWVCAVAKQPLHEK